jgi:uncharacterized protein
MTIDIKVITNAKRREIKRDGAVLRVKLMSSPADGKANEELIRYIAELFSVRKSGVQILKGEKERHKVLSIPVDEGTLERRLMKMERV